jgi:hypothetical protein
MDTQLKPLITDLKELSLGRYLASSLFERVTVKHGFDNIWDNAYEEAKKKYRVMMIGYDMKHLRSEEALYLLIDRSFRADRKFFDNLLNLIIKYYIEWIENEIDLENLFEDLELLKVPTNIIHELRAKYKGKMKIIKEREKVKIIEQEKDPSPKFEYQVIIETKRIEWIDKISMAKIEEVIDDLKSFAMENNDEDLIMEVVNQSQRWYRLQRKVRDNIITLENEQLESNQINKAILSIINSIYKKGSKKNGN